MVTSLSCRRNASKKSTATSDKISGELDTARGTSNKIIWNRNFLPRVYLLPMHIELDLLCVYKGSSSIDCAWNTYRRKALFKNLPTISNRRKSALLQLVARTRYLFGRKAVPIGCNSHKLVSWKPAGTWKGIGCVACIKTYQPRAKWGLQCIEGLQ